MKIHSMTFATDLGILRADCDEAGNLLRLGFTDGAKGEEPRTFPAAEAVARQVREYFRGERRVFDLPLRPAGTKFQQGVWKALQDIPYGETVSYQGLAQRLGNPKAIRAVGRANALNPICIVVPCHRVIGSDGSLTGFAYGLDRKRRLLELEGARFAGTAQLEAFST